MNRLTRLSFLVAAVGLAAAMARAEVVTYPAPAQEVLSLDYEVWADAKKVDVYAARVLDPPFAGKDWDFGGPYSFANFDMSGRTTVRITAKKSLRGTVIRPQSAGVQPIWKSDYELLLTLDAPCKLSIEPDGKNGPLLLFANPIEANAPKPGDANVLYFGPGVHNPGRIDVASGQTLYLAGGAVVKGAVAAQGDNIRIHGRGILDGNDYAWRKGPYGAAIGIRGNNVEISGITIRGSSHWTIVPRGSRHVTIRNVKLCNSRVQNDDGINPCNSQDVLIADCFIRSDDDCVAMKGLDAAAPNGNVEGITVENCILWCDRARVFLLGHESRAPMMRNIRLRNLDIIHFAMTPFLLEPGEDMHLEDIVVENVRINGEGQPELIRLLPTVNQYMRTKTPGYICNATFRNIEVAGKPGGYRVQLAGADARHNVGKVTFDNVVIVGDRLTRSSPALSVGNDVEDVQFLDHRERASAQQPAPVSQPLSVWDLAKSKQQNHRFSTLLTVQDVRDRLSNDEGLATAMDWCKKTGVTKVYLEVFRDGYQAKRETLERVKRRFQEAGFEVSGCVTTTQVGKPSSGWKVAACYTDRPTQKKLQGIFEYAASLFDEIMIDDFWFTDCSCPECDAARRAKTVTLADRTYPVASDRWEDYRCELMVRLSQENLLAAAKRVNPKARLIIKYPLWYDDFHDRGYDVSRETADFDWTWVGTETRDYGNARWGGTPPYAGYFIMRWLGAMGGEKCGGGWYDSLGTTEPTYLEQARQTVLGGARESMLFCYGSLLHGTGPKDIEALRQNVAELLSVAEQVRHREITGIAAYKPVNSHGEKEKWVFNFVGMMGLPLVPCHEFPADAKAAFFSIHALKDADFVSKLTAFLAAGKPVLLTDGLAKQLAGKLNLDAPHVRILPVNGAPKSLLQLPQTELDDCRAALLRPLRHSFRAPNRVGLYLFGDGSWVAENFNDEPVEIELDGRKWTIAARNWLLQWKE